MTNRTGVDTPVFGMTANTRTYYFRAYGLTFAAPFELQDLVPIDSGCKPDVTISYSEIGPKPDKYAKLEKVALTSAAGPRIYWKDIATFFIPDGTRIQIERGPNWSVELAQNPLLGVVAGALLHQRETFALHSSAVAIDHVAVAFLGHKNCGKSTLAAVLVERGHDFISDDILAFESRSLSEGHIKVVSSFPQFKLSTESISALGKDPADMASPGLFADKLAYRSIHSFSTDPVLLAKIYSPSFSDTFSITTLKAKPALAELLRHAYAPRVLGDAADRRLPFRSAGRILAHVPIAHLQRPKGLSELNRLADRIEIDVRQITGS